jgi:aryl-alcohol dehydrogenase-like predicted oxidoreductase
LNLSKSFYPTISKMAPPEGLPKMQYRFLGRSGLQVSAISLGGWLTYGGHVENGMRKHPSPLNLQLTNNVIENTFACMKAAYDVGINFFDCAEGYAGGESERVMGQAIKKFGWKRNDLVISTKVTSPLSSIVSIGCFRAALCLLLGVQVGRFLAEYSTFVVLDSSKKQLQLVESLLICSRLTGEMPTGKTR